MRPGIALVALAVCVASGCAGGGKARGATAVTIRTFTFAPDPVTIETATTVRWVNRDQILHTVTSRAAGERFDGRLDGAGTAFEHTFTTAGRFTYVCTRHPAMGGVVVVE